MKNKILNGLVIGLLATLTLATGVMAINKIITVNRKNDQVKKIDEVSKCVVTLFGKKYDVTELRKTHSGGDIFKCDTDMSEIYQGQHGVDMNRVKKYLIADSQQVSVMVTPTTTSTSKNNCIVTILSNKYDVTNLRKTHSGGDIFKCGTDMTTIYTKQHGTNLSRMTEYKIVEKTNVVAVPTAKPTSASGQCIVTLFGNQYNITSLVISHSGGNVFNCGTDMSSIYQGKHGTSLTRMVAYAISGNSTVTSAPAPTSTTCIITVNGQQYDVSTFRTKHKGGNVFVCGGDNTSIFTSQHGTKWDMLHDYLVGGGRDDD